MTVTFIDVGQGDSILIDLGETEILIDAGERSTVTADYLAPYVQGALEVIVATHPHADHIGGLMNVISRCQVSEIWTNGATADTVTYTQFAGACAVEGAVIREVERGQTFTVGLLTLQVLNPSPSLVNDTNNDSVVLWLKYGDIEFLFEGDAEREAEFSMLASACVPDCDILKVGHHASRTASSAAYLNVCKPETAIYMAGIDNRYGHPHQEALNALEAAGAAVYGTDVCGTITVTTDGLTYIVSSEKG